MKLKLTHFMPKFTLALSNNQLISQFFEFGENAYKKMTNPQALEEARAPEEVQNPAVEMIIEAEGPTHASGSAALQTNAGRSQIIGDVDVEAGGSLQARFIGRGPATPGPTSISGSFRWRLPNAACFQDGVLRVAEVYDLDNKKGDTTVAFDYTLYKDRSASVHGVAIFEPFSDKPAKIQVFTQGSTEGLASGIEYFFCKLKDGLKKSLVINQRE